MPVCILRLLFIKCAAEHGNVGVTVVALSSLAPMVLPLGVRSLAFAESICRFLILRGFQAPLTHSSQRCTEGLLFSAVLCSMSRYSFMMHVQRD